MIKASTLRQQIAQIQEIEKQTNTFRLKYDCLPGDCANATTFLGTTDSRGNTVTNGDGDGLIRATTGSAAPYAATDCQSGNISSELTQFFLQITDAGIGNYSSDGVSSQLGKGTPTTLLNPNTMTFVSCLLGSNITKPTALAGAYNYIILGARGSSSNGTHRVQYDVCQAGQLAICQSGAGIVGVAGISFSDAGLIDQKIDDGVPNNGQFAVLTALNTGCTPTNYGSNAIATGCNAVVGKRLGQ